MDWYPTIATFAGIEVPKDRVIDGRDIVPMLKGETKFIPGPAMKKSLNAAVPLRRSWNPPGEWASIIKRHEYLEAYFYHGSQGALAAVRWRNWKRHNVRSSSLAAACGPRAPPPNWSPWLSV